MFRDDWFSLLRIALTAVLSYFGLILAFALKYDRKLEMGTLIATMLPYSVTFLITWTAFFYLWVFVLGIPIGPGVDVHLPPVAAP